MDQISVVVSGTGFMGREILAAVAAEPDLKPVGVIEKFSQEEFVSIPRGDTLIPLGNDPASVFDRAGPRVVVDFTNNQWTPLVAEAAVARGISMVIGTTGLTEAFLKKLDADCRAKGLGSFVAPNFAIGAVLMIHLAKLAAPYFDFAEITESHQEKKIDAPSGTAVLAAREMVAARGRPFEHTDPEKQPLAGGRGASYEGVALHSRRMPGFVAHHEISFGGLGQTLSIRHDSNGRDSFIPGVLLAIREVVKRQELVIGLDKLIGL